MQKSSYTHWKFLTLAFLLWGFVLFRKRLNKEKLNQTCTLLRTTKHLLLLSFSTQLDLTACMRNCVCISRKPQQATTKASLSPTSLQNNNDINFNILRKTPTIPRVALVLPRNSFLQSLIRKLDFPTAASPARTIL